MDEARFDTLVRQFARPAARRTALRWLGAAAVTGAWFGRDRSPTLAQGPFGCAEGHPCYNGRQTACCLSGEYCCNRKTDNPICTASKKACEALG
jgi:hypothetical protein